ncbi:restriction endonuclease subunit S [Streptococcus suis]|nr:restriction endonuclease subunit S [Streptococcus suis]
MAGSCVDNLHYEKFADGTVKAFEKDIPEGWAITHFPEICALEKGSIKRGPFGSSITKTMFVPKGDDTYKVYEQGNAIRKTVEYGDYWLPKADYKRLEGFAVKAGDIIVSCAGTIGETFVIPKKAPDGVINQALLRLTLNHEVIDEQYFLLMFKTLVDTLKSNAVGSAIKNLASIKFLKYETPFLLPPIAEQQRIVSKVHEAFEKVELYGYWFNRLQKINNEFPEKLRKSILQYAMQGKLVPQDPNDEPVEVLLEKIRQEKQKLFEEGKLKKKDLQESIIYKGDDNSYYEKSDKTAHKIDVPYSIPSSWKWSNLKTTTLFGSFKSVNGNDIPNSAWVLDMEDIEKDTGRILNKHYKVETDLFKSNKYIFSKGDVLYGKLRPYLRKVAIADEPGFVTTEVFPINVTSQNNPIFFRLLMLSPYFSGAVNQSVYGVKMPRVGTNFLAEMIVPVVPASEQARIIEQVQRAFRLVEKLGQ